VLATAATVAAVAVLSGGPGTTDAGPGFSDRTTATGKPSTDAGTGDRVAVPVYFVGGTSHGPRLFSEHHTDSGSPRVAALQQAVDGSAEDPDYRSFWPAGTRVEAVRVDESKPGSPVVVELGGADLADRPAGVSPAQAELSVQQLLWTLRAGTGQPASVEIRVAGRPTSTLLGVPTGRQLTARSADAALAQVQVTSPADGATVHSPFTVDGKAAAFEANVQWELKQGATVVRRGFTTAEECCTLSPFSFTVQAPPGSYTLVVHDEDVSGGEGLPPWQDTKQITVE
jgi:hypothetical protein